jgi:hypothetical protein
MLMAVLVFKDRCNCSHPTMNRSRYLTDFGFSKPYNGEQYSSGRSGYDGYRTHELTNKQCQAYIPIKQTYGLLIVFDGSDNQRKAQSV